MMQSCGQEEIVGRFKVQDGKRREKKKKRKKRERKKKMIELPRLEVIWVWGSGGIRDMLESPGWKGISTWCLSLACSYLCLSHHSLQLC